MKCGQHNHKSGDIFRTGEAEQDDGEIFKVLGREEEITFSALWNLQGTILYHPTSIILIISPEGKEHFPGADHLCSSANTRITT